MGSVGKTTNSSTSTRTEQVDNINSEAQKKVNNMTAAQLSKYVKANGLQTAYNKRRNSTNNLSRSNEVRILRDLVMDDLRKKAIKKLK